MSEIIILAAVWLEVTTLDKRKVFLNSDEIVSLAAPKDSHLLAEGVKCVVSLTDRKFVSVTETCEQVEKQIREKSP